MTDQIGLYHCRPHQHRRSGPPLDPGAVIAIEAAGDRFTGGFYEWNGHWSGCTGHKPHLTRLDALRCAEDQLAYRR